MDFLNKYSLKPFAFGADGPDAFDCWGLVRAVYSEIGIELSPLDYDNTLISTLRACTDECKQCHWEPVTVLENYDVIVMGRGHIGHHVGVWFDDLGVIHALENVGVIISSNANLAMNGWKILRCYRYVG